METRLHPHRSLPSISTVRFMVRSGLVQLEGMLFLEAAAQASLSRVEKRSWGCGNKKTHDASDGTAARGSLNMIARTQRRAHGRSVSREVCAAKSRAMPANPAEHQWQFPQEAWKASMLIPAPASFHPPHTLDSPSAISNALLPSAAPNILLLLPFTPNLTSYALSQPLTVACATHCALDWTPAIRPLDVRPRPNLQATGPAQRPPFFYTPRHAPSQSLITPFTHIHHVRRKGTVLCGRCPRPSTARAAHRQPRRSEATA